MKIPELSLLNGSYPRMDTYFSRSNGDPQELGSRRIPFLETKMTSPYRLSANSTPYFLESSLSIEKPQSHLFNLSSSSGETGGTVELSTPKLLLLINLRKFGSAPGQRVFGSHRRERHPVR